jgi:hypothetical protein
VERQTCLKLDRTTTPSSPLNSSRIISVVARLTSCSPRAAYYSLQNLLFSILLFRRTVGRYPRQIRLVTHAFKARRFLELHATAIRWPEDRIQIQGIDPIMSSKELDETLEGEEESGYALWDEDPLGAGESLSGKRRQRGWDENVVAELVEGLEEGIRELVMGEMPEKLPWEST